MAEPASTGTGCPVCKQVLYYLYRDEANGEYIVICISGHEVKRFYSLQPDKSQAPRPWLT